MKKRSMSSLDELRQLKDNMGVNTIKMSRISLVSLQDS